MAILAVKDVVRCPTCGSPDVVYTCEPKCCFNHLCSDCRTTFQLLTRKSSRAVDVARPEAEEPFSGDPAAACAACESLRVAVVDAGSPPLLVCSNCHSALELAYEDIAPDAP
jgi:hypothetical protein